MKIQDSTIYPSPTLCIKPQALHMIAYKGYSSGNPTSTRGIQVVTLQVQEVQLQVVAIDLHKLNFMWFRPFLWSLMTKGERNEQIYELSLDDKGGDEMRVRIKRSNIEEDQYSWTRRAHK